MNRRELLKQIAFLTGGSVVGAEVFLSGCGTGPKTEAGFTNKIIALLDEVGETIIPTTATPGAKAAQVGEFMKVWVTDCLTQKEQDAFFAGLPLLDEACIKMHNKPFMDCDAKQRHDFLVSLEKEAKEFNGKRDETDKPLRETAKKEGKEFAETPPHYYTMVKQMTLNGFFTSKTGATETLRHIQVPGKYDGALPYKKGDKAWASSL
jgi:Gluconate 2-dehydrogenase subunit 3